MYSATFRAVSRKKQVSTASKLPRTSAAAYTSAKSPAHMDMDAPGRPPSAGGRTSHGCTSGTPTARSWCSVRRQLELSSAHGCTSHRSPGSQLSSMPLANSM